MQPTVVSSIVQMSNPPWIVDNVGRLWRLVKKNRLDFHVYEWDMTAPFFLQSGTQTPIIGVTTEGRLYDLEKGSYLNSNKSNFRSASICCTPLEGRYVFAVTDNDNLYSFRYVESEIVDWKLEMPDVDVIVPSLGHAYGMAIHTNYKEWFYITTYSEDEPYPRNLGLIEGITPTLTPTSYIKDGLIVQGQIAFVVGNYDEEPIFEVIRLPHNSILIGLIIDTTGDLNHEEPFIISINQDLDRLSVTTQTVGFNDENDVWNSVLEDINLKSEVSEFIRLGISDYLLCRDGLTYHINQNGEIINTKIPSYIFTDLRFMMSKRVSNLLK